jgi:hypothetical protein
MRRALSISLIFVLCWTVVSPAWAASCTHQNGAKMCHRPAHGRDCGMMEHHSNDSDSQLSLSAVQKDESCPMSCCMQASSRALLPVRGASGSTHVLASHLLVRMESQVFSSNGFSSHTDRGPPCRLN